jgi:hypothetical protein
MDIAGPAFAPRFHIGDGSLLGLCGNPDRCRQQPAGAGSRGFAVRFHLAEHVHTDIIAHSVDNFPVRTAEGLLEFLNAVITTNPAGPHPNAIERFLGAHPAARPKPPRAVQTSSEIAANNAGEQQRVIFDPIPRVDGIEASADPLFEPRANIYLMSGRRRRAARERP